VTRRAIEAALRSDPGDEQAWAVFGDLLADAGDSRGELIALDQRARASERPFEQSLLEHQARELFEREHRRWLGPLADAGLDIVWERGFVREVVIARAHVAAVRALLALPTSALLRRLVLVHPRGLASIVALLREHEYPLAALEVRGLADGNGSLAPLAELGSLVQLGIEANALTELGALGGLAQLRTLNLRRCTGALDGLVGSEGGFEGVTELEVSAHVAVASLGPDALEPLAGLTGLRELDLGDAGWTSAEALAGLVALERLDLRSTEVLGLEPLRGMLALRELNCSGCTGLTNLEPLAELPELRRLRLGYTRVRDLRPLAGLPALEQLDLAGTPVSELLPLFGIASLRKVDLKACEVHDVAPLLARGVTVHGVRPRERTWRDLADELLRGPRG
jgi:Leucine-rich repeat (LRR) protein